MFGPGPPLDRGRPSPWATSRYEAQARREWDRAPPAWGTSGVEMRQLEKEPLMTQQGAVSDLRAFSLDECPARCS